MIQLQPQEYFTIVRVLEDVSDANTYYVRATIRNSKTDVVVETVDLTDKGDRRFTKEWQVTPDTSGEGFYIDITTTVYTDSAYTVLAGDYGEQSSNYLVQQRWSHQLGGGGGGSDVDYKKIKKIVEKVVSEREMVEIPDIDFSTLHEAILSLQDSVDNIVIPEQKEIDLSEVINKIKDVDKSVKSIVIPKPEKMPKPEKIDLTPIIKSSSKNNAELKNNIEKEITNLKKELIDKNIEFINKIKEDKIKEEDEKREPMKAHEFIRSNRKERMRNKFNKRPFLKL